MSLSYERILWSSSSESKLEMQKKKKQKQKIHFDQWFFVYLFVCLFVTCINLFCLFHCVCLIFLHSILCSRMKNEAFFCNKEFQPNKYIFRFFGASMMMMMKTENDWKQFLFIWCCLRVCVYVCLIYVKIIFIPHWISKKNSKPIFIQQQHNIYNSELSNNKQIHDSNMYPLLCCVDWNKTKKKFKYKLRTIHRLSFVCKFFCLFLPFHLKMIRYILLAISSSCYCYCSQSH